MDNWNALPERLKLEMFVQELESCINANNGELFKRLLVTEIGQQADLDQITLDDGRSIAHSVAIEGADQVLDVLIEKKVLLNEPDFMRDMFWHRKPIHYAAEHGYQIIIKKLLQAGVGIDCRDNDGRTALHWAAMSGHLETIQFLVAMGADVNDGEQLDGFLPLHAAITLDQYQICEYLITKGANVNQPDNLGYTALLTACCYGYTELVHLFLANGAEINTMTYASENCLHMTVVARYLDCVHLLVEAGIDINMPDYKGDTALILACKGEKDGHNIVRYLIQHGIDINTQNHANESSLYHAVINNHVSSVMCLLSAGYDGTNEDWIKRKQFPALMKHTSQHLCSLLYEMATNPRTLLQLSINEIRFFLKKNCQHTRKGVNQLPLPNKLKSSIMFDELL